MTIRKEKRVFGQSVGGSSYLPYSFLFHRAEFPFADQTSADDNFVLQVLSDVVITLSATLRIWFQRKPPQREKVMMKVIVVDLFWIDATRIIDVLRHRAHSRLNYKIGGENVEKEADFSSGIYALPAIRLGSIHLGLILPHDANGRFKTTIS